MKPKQLFIHWLCFVVINLLPLHGCSFLQKSRNDMPPIHVILSDDSAPFDANAFLLEGKDEVMLIDSQRTVTQAKKIIKKIHRINKPLTLVFITNANPGHYLGAREIRQAFPGARYVTSPSVYKELKKNGRKIWADNARQLEKEGRPQESVKGPLDLGQEVNNLIFQNLNFELIEFTLGDGHPLTAIYNKQWKVLFASDLLFNGYHLQPPQNSPQRWIENLKEIKNLPVDHIYPSHGKLSGRSLIDKNKEYLEKFQEAVSQGLSADQVEAQLTKLYPTYLPVYH